MEDGNGCVGREVHEKKIKRGRIKRERREGGYEEIIMFCM